ncbi:iron chelate uptake ABC transporter family permease subunit [Cereibacter sphaeroides]|nr:iron chelate uptake ABC transporter family permease subunit [Cereibacter sphaeroides]
MSRPLPLLALTLALPVVALLALAQGDYPVSLPELLGALAGRSEGPVHLVVIDWRLPRVGLALTAGAALGLAGALFQSITRNPLGSPDVIGLNAGAYTGALLALILGGGQVLSGALLGGLVTALAVYLLAWRGGLHGTRLVLVGIGISAMATAANTWLLMTARLEVAMGAATWGAGSLNGATLAQLAPMALALPVLALGVTLLARPLRQLELGDDLSRAQGVPVALVRLCGLGLGVVLTALATATAGPIAFVALAAPQIGRRLTGASGAAFLPAALTGALLLALADLVAAQGLPGARQIPVGVVTLVLGGVYLLALLRLEARK